MPNIETIVAPTYALNLRDAPRPPEVVWTSPLDVLFSQNVICTKFTDGRSVDDVVKIIRALPQAELDEEAGASDKEPLILEPPFPGIQAVRWAPKLRDGQGKPLSDGQGGFRLGAEGLFTVDNRRLYALQRAAVAQWPKRCRVPVQVITERSEVMTHLKKFRTRTNGLSITISEWNGVGRDNSKDFSAMRVWDWRSAISSIEAGAAGVNAAMEAADVGSCGCWEYLDNQDILRGPFSNWQMRQWWQHGMLPADLRIRPFDAATASNKVKQEDFNSVQEAFSDAPEPFAAGWSPRAKEPEGEWHKCAQCNRKKWEGWSAHGEWYCLMCWKRWQQTGRKEAQTRTDSHAAALDTEPRCSKSDGGRE